MWPLYQLPVFKELSVNQQDLSLLFVFKPLVKEKHHNLNKSLPRAMMTDSLWHP
jgi:hypothetical protein